jgi:hypothetical protein
VEFFLLVIFFSGHVAPGLMHKCYKAKQTGEVCCYPLSLARALSLSLSHTHTHTHTLTHLHLYVCVCVWAVCGPCVGRVWAVCVVCVLCVCRVCCVCVCVCVSGKPLRQFIFSFPPLLCVCGRRCRSRGLRSCYDSSFFPLLIFSFSLNERICRSGGLGSRYDSSSFRGTSLISLSGPRSSTKVCFLFSFFCFFFLICRRAAVNLFRPPSAN